MTRTLLSLFGCGSRYATRLIFAVVFFYLIFCGGTPVQAAANNDSLLGYWKFDGNLSDASGDGSTAADGTGSTTYSTSIPTVAFPDTQSLSFSGSTSYITFANQAGLRPTSAVTLSTWVYLDAYPTATSIISGNYLASQNQGFFLEIGAATVDFSLGNGTALGSTSFSATSLPIGSWFLLTGTWDGTTAKIYKNGSLAASTAFSGPLYYSSTQFQAGNFSGKLDDMRLYNRALSQTEVTALANGQHLSSAWTGNVSTSYDSAGNWNPIAVPDPYALVTIVPVTNQPVFSASEGMAGLVIAAGSRLDIGGFNLTMNDGGTFSNDGTLVLANVSGQLVTALVNDTDSGTVSINASSSVTGLRLGGDYYNLDINCASGATLSSNSSLNVHGSLSLTSGTLDVSLANYAINLAGNWTKTGGSFNPRAGTVFLSGTGQAISGSNTFYNLTKSTSSGDTLTFQSGSTQTFLGTLSLQGAGSAGHFLLLRPSTSGTVWNIDPQGARNVSAVDVQDSTNVNVTGIELPGINIDSGNNTNWLFDTAPPVLAINPVSSPTVNDLQPVTGTATEAVATVASVEFQMETAGGSWSACSADDGSFNGSTENFTCTPASALSNSSHTMFIRTTDTNGNVSANSQVGFTVDTSLSNNTYTLSYSAGTGGSLSGSATQSVQYGSDGSAVTAVPDAGYHFVGWSDSSTDNPRTDLSVIQDISVTASFASDSLSLVYKSDDHGSIDGDREQTVSYGGSGSEVTADADTGYRFKKWSDGSDENPRQDSDVRASITVTAEFEKKEYDLTYKCGSGGHLSGDTTQHVKYEEDGDAIEAVADSGYRFEKWSDGSTKNPRKDTNIDDDLTVKAEFSVVTVTAPASSQSGETTATTTATPAAVPDTATAKTDYNGDTSTDWQMAYFGSSYCYDQARCGADADPDGDGLSNSEEFRLGTDPLKADTDKDGVSDTEELKEGRNPAKYSKDGKGDKIDYEDPRGNKATKNDEYRVTNVELVDVSGGEKRLKIEGQAKPGEWVTVYVFSDPIVLTVKADEDGSWSYVLDKSLEDGQHQVYVAVTDSAGKITEKSDPLTFIKTAEAITIIPPAEAAAADRAASPVESGYAQNLTISIIIGIVGLIVSAIIIGTIRRRKAEEPA